MIRVFPRQTNATPTDANAFYGGPPLWDTGEREVHVSCTFIEDKSKAEWLAKLWDTQGRNVTLGGPAYDDPGGEFVPGRYLTPGYVITSRGCNNACWHCQTWRREGKIRELPITDGWNVLDSNLLQCSYTHIRSVFGMLSRQSERPVFSGGLDAARLEDWHINCLAIAKPQRIYFAYDQPDDYEPLRIAAAKIVAANVCGKHDRMCYVLIGYPKDTLTDAAIRLESVLDLGLTPMAMLYSDGKTKQRPEWRRFQRRWARPALIYGAQAD